MNITNISIVFDKATTYNVTKNGMKDYPNWRVIASRVIDGKPVIVRRRFSYRKFGGDEGAKSAASTFANYIISSSDWQFTNARRHVGRPFRTEYLASADLNKA